MTVRPGSLPSGPPPVDAQGGVPLFTLYRREGCHLCEDLENQLEELLEPGSYRLRRVDIDDFTELREQYHVLVPVLVHGKTQICHHFLDLDAVRRVLASYNSQSCT